MTKPSAVLLIDASIYIFQYYFSLPDHWFSEEESWPTAAVYGYTAFLIRLLSQQKPQHVAVCFDESLENCFRNEIYPDYKSSRVLPDPALAFQLEACKQVTNLLGLKTFASDRYEADDLIGSIYQNLHASERAIAILTRDKDLGQIISRQDDFLWDYAKYQSTIGDDSLRASQSFYNDLTAKWGVTPSQFPDFLALVGDTIDDIPGVPGIGIKTAAKLLDAFESIDDLLNQIDHIQTLSIRGAKKIAQKIDEHQSQIKMAKQLATIKKELRLVDNINELSVHTFDEETVAEYFRLMGFPKLAKRLTMLPNISIN